MELSVYVGSKKNRNIVEVIPGTGMTPTDAIRNAVNTAHGLRRIADATALTEHEVAVRKREQALERFAPKMNAASLNHSVPFWRQREDTRYH